jgi:hypothetical protein
LVIIVIVLRGGGSLVVSNFKAHCYHTMLQLHIVQQLLVCSSVVKLEYDVEAYL